MSKVISVNDNTYNMLRKIKFETGKTYGKIIEECLQKEIKNV